MQQQEESIESDSLSDGLRKNEAKKKKITEMGPQNHPNNLEKGGTFLTQKTALC